MKKTSTIIHKAAERNKHYSRSKSINSKRVPYQLTQRSALQEISTHPNLAKINSPRKHILEESLETSKTIFNHTGNLIESAIMPAKNYLFSNLQGTENSKLRDQLLSLSAPAMMIFGLLNIFNGIRAVFKKSKISSGAELTKGFLALQTAKKLTALATNGGFENLKHMKKEVNTIGTHLAMIGGLTVFQQFNTKQGNIQQLFSDKFKDNVVDSFSWMRFLNPANIFGSIISGGSLGSASRTVKEEALLGIKD